ncbi:twin-arginine translocase TatA/TatE family subunit [Jiangella endophytica]|uniref:twin-arginine translocase TatA/TatE family subunit n=1 Tax=Jiangella endophytica TaxID=1623398 RepID=UPI000E34E40F|nr:twin-arginine translocase TatA/TatE family subunit [Jiangella endophytica]
MFDIGIGEVFVLLVVALLVFGPDRLPDMARQAAGFVRDLRTMVANARKDLSGSVGDLGIDKEDLKTLSDLRNPKSFVRQKVLDGIDLGLDDDDDTSPSRRTNGNGTRPSARSASTGGERVGETVDVPPPSADVPPAPEEETPPPPMEDTPAAPAAAAASPGADASEQPASEPSTPAASAPAPAASAAVAVESAAEPAAVEPEAVPAETARSPRFDPDAT